MTLAASIAQPWCYATMNLGRTIDNRMEPTDYRGTLLIHAAKKISRYDYANAVWWMAHRSLAHPRGLPPFEELDRGGIVGVCRLVDCVRVSSSPWFEGPYGFVLEGIQAVDFFPCKGALGLFDVEWPPVKKSLPVEEGRLL